MNFQASNNIALWRPILTTTNIYTNMKEVKLKICAGTMCYVMGGAQLTEIADSLPENIREHVEISLIPCLKQCEGSEKPPYVELNGKIITGISKENLVKIVKEEVKNAVR